jgi:hypothetical protein
MTLWTYQIEVSGFLQADTLVKLEADLHGVFVMTEPAGTLLTGTAADQAALLGVLDRLDSLGLQVHEFRRVPDPPESTATPDPGRAAGLRPEDSPR